MKGYKLDLLTLLISLFTLGACNNPDEIGLDVDPTNSINTLLDSSATVNAVTVTEDTQFTKRYFEVWHQCSFRLCSIGS